MRLSPLISLNLLVVLPFAAIAQTEREHDAHVHGHSQIDLVYENGQLELELHSPGMDIVGFEHSPRDPDQSQAIEKALAALDSHRAWLVFEGADCTVERVKTHTHGYDQDESGSHEHDDHDHDAGHDHAEFHLTLGARCSAMPDALQIRLADRFPGIQRIRVDYITDAGQNRVELASGDTRVPLR